MFHLRSREMMTAMDRTLEDIWPQELERPAAFPLLIGLLLNRWYSDQERTMALRRMLLRCLRHLQPDHADCVTAAHRKELYYELQRKRNDPYFVCAILKGLAGIEDQAAIPHVIPLAEGHRSAAEFPAIQAAARECLIELGYFG